MKGGVARTFRLHGCLLCIASASMDFSAHRGGDEQNRDVTMHAGVKQRKSNNVLVWLMIHSFTTSCVHPHEGLPCLRTTMPVSRHGCLRPLIVGITQWQSTHCVSTLSAGRQAATVGAAGLHPKLFTRLSLPLRMHMGRGFTLLALALPVWPIHTNSTSAHCASMRHE